MRFSDFVVPVVFCLILGFGLFKKVDVYDTFTTGAASGIKTSFRILPALIGLMTCIGMLQASGAVEIFCAFMTPAAEHLGLPAEILPLALIRPLSGSGALSVCQQLLEQYGPDSLIGRIASVLQGSSETTFYTISLYFASIRISRTRYAVAASLTGDLVCFLASCWMVRLLFCAFPS